MIRCALLLMVVSTLVSAGDWSDPADVLHELKPCVTYRARFEDDLLVIRATLQPGWHTFAMDNERRAAEKLAGKRSLGIDQPTRIQLPSDVHLQGSWYQLEPKDFSKPDLRWYSWGFEKEAIFAARLSSRPAKPVQIQLRGQACTESTCKNIDLLISVPVGSPLTDGTVVHLTSLVEVR